MNLHIRTPAVKFDKPPVLIAAWPGAGNAGIMAVDYLRSILNAEPLAFMDMNGLVFPEYVPVQDGVMKPPLMPESGFYFTRNPEMILFESDAKFRGKENMTVLKAILKIAADFNVTHIFTASASPQSIKRNDKPGIFFSTGSKEFSGELATYGVTPVTSGFLSGPEGLLPRMAEDAGIKAACLQTGIPADTVSMPYPKGSLEIIRTLMSIFNFSVDTGELEDIVSRIDYMKKKVDDKIKGVFPGNEFSNGLPPVPPAGGPEEHNSEKPDSMLGKIEKLFKEVEKDRSRAPELKKELDRLKLYKKYEDRFLNLFRNRNE